MSAIKNRDLEGLDVTRNIGTHSQEVAIHGFPLLLVRVKPSFGSKLIAVCTINTLVVMDHSVRLLAADGLHSSLRIARIGMPTFVAKYGSTIGREDAMKIFDSAEYTHSMAINLTLNYGKGGLVVNNPFYRNWAKILAESMTPTIPDWSTLFGSLDSCSCDGCRAMDSPAAYLVDILHFLKDRRLIDQIFRNSSDQISRVTYKHITKGDVDVEMSAKDVLFERRPDIGAIELSCENTNTLLPYIDLAIEILENAVSPPLTFKIFDLPSTAIVLLDTPRTYSQCRNAKSAAIGVFPVMSSSADLTVLFQKDLTWPQTFP